MNATEVIANWNSYARSHQSVMPSQMLTLNKRVAEQMYGDVADFGCGAGKAIPFILNQEQVISYTGIDCSPEMVRKAQWMSRQFPEKKATVIEDRIERVQLKEFDSALSINSYYTWQDPETVLRHIQSQLKPGAMFILVTLNAKLNMPALLSEAEMELIAHPHWHEFKQHNLGISTNNDVHFIDLDELIGQVRNAGFRVEQADTNLYAGGLNFLSLSKR